MWKIVKMLDSIETENIDRILKILFYFVFFVFSFLSGYIMKEQIVLNDLSKMETGSSYLGNGFYSGDTINMMCLNNIKYMRIENASKTSLTINPKINPLTKTYILCKESKEENKAKTEIKKEN